jgi:uncharacterized membrane protein
MSAPFAPQSTIQGNHMTMADDQHDVQHDFEPHAETWHGFIRGSIATILATIFVLVGLVSIGFGSFLPLFLGFLGMIAGFVAIAIDLRTGSTAWGASLSVLGLFALITLINIY